MDHSLEGWSFTRGESLEWLPWGPGGSARARVLAVADGFHVVLVEAEAGYQGEPHDHRFPEFLYVLDGDIRSQGQGMKPGDAYAAAAGSVHTDFAAESGATYLSIFKL
jgi:quercetin dioxygenase-like cupin family protein